MKRSDWHCGWTPLCLALFLFSPSASAQHWLEYAPDLERDRPLSSELYGLADYLELPERLAPHSVSVSEDELRESLHWIWHDGDRELARGVLEEALPGAEFSRELLAALGLPALLEGLPERSLRMAVLDEYLGARHSEQLLLFEDPLVGRFAARILFPRAAGPRPTLIALPGHDRDVYEFCVEFSCEDYLEAGYVVAVLQLRADEGESIEHRTAAYLLRHGFSLAGLHVYEALQLARFLRTRAEVDSSRMSLLGHSGGAVLAGMAAFIDDSFATLIADTTAVFTEDMDGGLLCSTSALLYPYHPQLAMFDLLPSARLYEYGFPEGNSALLQFLAEQWGAAPKSQEATSP